MPIFPIANELIVASFEYMFWITGEAFAGKLSSFSPVPVVISIPSPVIVWEECESLGLFRELRLPEAVPEVGGITVAARFDAMKNN